MNEIKVVLATLFDTRLRVPISQVNNAGTSFGDTSVITDCPWTEFMCTPIGGKQLKMAECLTPDNQHYTILSVAVKLCSCEMLFAAKATR